MTNQDVPDVVASPMWSIVGPVQVTAKRLAVRTPIVGIPIAEKIENNQPMPESESDETVFVTRHHQTGNSILHLREDCAAFRADSTIVAKPRSVFPDDQPICKRCTGEARSGGGPNTRYFEALCAAAEREEADNDG